MTFAHATAIADDHAIARAGFRRLLEAESGIAVVCEAADGDGAHAAVCDGLALRLRAGGADNESIARRLCVSAKPVANRLGTCRWPADRFS